MEWLLICQSNQYLCLNCWKSKWFHWRQRILTPSSLLQNSSCPFVQHVQKSKNIPKGARSGFYQKGFCLFQFGMENCCAEVFEELGLKLDAVSSSSHLLFFFLWTFWSLWMYNLWCFPLSCDNECQWASWSRSLSFEKNLTEELT